jgi:hypothetical protein
MKTDFKISQPQWMQEVNARIENPPPNRDSLPLHEIVKQFKKAMDDNKVDTKLAERIQTLSEEKKKYYQKGFGFVKQFFSSLRNLFHLGQFSSSGTLGVQYAGQFIKEHPSFPAGPKMEEPKLEVDVKEEKIPVAETSIMKTLAKAEEQQLEELEKEEIESDESSVYESAESSPIETPFFTPTPTGSPPPEGFHQIEGEVGEPYEAATQADHDELMEKLQKAAEEEKKKEAQLIKQGPKIEEKVSEKASKEEEPIREIGAPSTKEKIKPKEVAPIKETPPSGKVDLKDEMYVTFFTIWTNATPEERVNILKIWKILTELADVVKWEPVKNMANVFQLELKEGLVGEAEGVPGQTLFTSTMKIAFSEEKVDETYQFVMTFLEGGIMQKIKLAVPVERIIIKGDMVTVEAKVNFLIKKALKAIGYPPQATDSVEAVLNALGKIKWRKE